MQWKLSKEELAQKAMELLEQAEKFEESKQWYKAIEHYQEAAECLQQSGYLTHRIEDFYTRATEINNYLKQQKIYEQSQAHVQKAQLDQLQDQAFALLDDAKSYEASGNLQNAIQNYLSAIKLLSQSGWAETQLENLKSKIMKLAEIQERQKHELADAQAPIQPQVSGSMAQPVVDEKTVALKTYEDKKKQEEDMQNQAFVFLDTAKRNEKDKKYAEAILNYQKAIELLNSLGWIQQTQSIQKIIDKLIQEDKSLESIQAQQPVSTSLDASLLEKPLVPQSELDLKKKKLIKFEEKKKREEEIQTQAFELIDNGKKLERNRQFDEALKCFEDSITMLKSIGWDAYIQPIINSINDIKERKEREIQAEQVKKDREEGLIKLQQMIQDAQKEDFVESAQETELRRREYEQKRQEALKKEEQFFTVLDEADQLLQQFNYKNAMNGYKKALDMLRNMGSGWESYIPAIQETLSSIEQRERALTEEETEILRKNEERKRKENEVQKKVAEELRKEREKLELTMLVLKEREEEISYREQEKQKAFKFIDAGQSYLNQGELDKAIYAYQNAGNLFAEIQWADELHLIESTIKEIKNKKNELDLRKQQKLKEDLERLKKKSVFQRQIAEQLDLEYEKIIKMEFTASKQKEDLKSYEEKRDSAFKLLNDSDMLLKQSQYDEALENYHKANIILIDIQYPTNAIREMIQNIQEMKKEQELQKQKEDELAAKKKSEEKQFQAKVTEKLTKEKGRLEEKQIELMKQEQMQVLLEKKREEAFNNLDKADNFTKNMEYDQAIESYRKAELLLNELHFPTHSIKNMMANVITLKKEHQIAQEVELKRELEQLKEESQLQSLVEERQRQYRTEKIALQMAEAERNRVIESQLSAREAAYSLLEDAGKYLKRRDPDFDKGISFYIQARDLLSEKIGWEPEINNMNRLIQDLQHEKAMFLEKRRLTERAKYDRQQEYLEFQQELVKRTVEYEKEETRRKNELQKYEEIKKLGEEFKEQAIILLDEGKRYAKLGDFNKAYNSLNKAKIHFKEMGWGDHIHYIETEINNTRLLEQKTTKEDLELKRIHKKLEDQVNLEILRREEEDKRIRQTIGDIGDLAGDVKQMFETRREQIELAEQQKDEFVKREAKEFSRNLAKMMNIKQELREELKKAQKEEATKHEQLKKEQEREAIGDLKRMIKEAAKKDKKE